MYNTLKYSNYITTNMNGDQFIQYTIDTIINPKIKQINYNFEYMSKRFDDIDCKTNDIKSKINTIQRDSSRIPQLYQMLKY